MVLNAVDIFLVIGSAQGFILSIILFQKRNDVQANYFLSLLISFYSLVLLDLFFNEISVYHEYPFIQSILIGISLAVFPFYYLYTKSLIYKSVHYLKNEWLHFIPLIIYKLFFFIYTFLYPIKPDSPFELPYIFLNWLIAIQAIAYIISILLLLKYYSEKIKQIYSEIEKLRLNWLTIITYATIAVIIVYLSEFILIHYNISMSKNIFDFSSFFAVANIYAIGYFGLFKSDIFKEADLAKSFEQIDEGENKKYEKSGLTQENAEKYLKKLIHIMETDKPYKNPSITLSELSKLSEIKPHNLSEILNTKLNQNFFDFINFYRVEEVKKYLKNESKKNFTILALAFEAGFNSKTSFNTIFKKVTLMTPSEYKKTLISDN